MRLICTISSSLIDLTSVLMQENYRTGQPLYSCIVLTQTNFSVQYSAVRQPDGRAKGTYTASSVGQQQQIARLLTT